MGIKTDDFIGGFEFKTFQLIFTESVEEVKPLIKLVVTEFGASGAWPKVLTEIEDTGPTPI